MIRFKIYLQHENTLSIQLMKLTNVTRFVGTYFQFGTLSLSLPNRWSPCYTQRHTELKFQLSALILAFSHIYTISRLPLFSSMAITHNLKHTISMPTSSHFTPSIPSPTSPFKTHSNSLFHHHSFKNSQRPNPTTNSVQMLFLP